MNIFISWSGDRSQAVARALRDWLPDVLHELVPWMSGHDIVAGSRWATDLSQVLEKSTVGIICLTPENRQSAWILYEAGAISRSVSEGKLIPLLIDMDLSDLDPPLSQFQSTKADKSGVYRLLESLNPSLEKPFSGDRLIKVFDKWWPDLEAKMHRAVALPVKASGAPARGDREVLNEVLEIVRAMVQERPREVVGRLLKDAITIDTAPLYGGRGDRFLLALPDDMTAQALLDEVWKRLNLDSHVPAYTYGKNWLLRHARTGTVYTTIGVEYCKSQGKVPDDTAVASLGIRRGDVLEVIEGHPRPAR